MKNILFIDGGGWNGITTVQVNVINFFLDKGHFIEVIIFDNGIKPDQVKLDRWPKHQHITYRVISQRSVLDKICNRLFFLKHFLKFLKCRHILKRFETYYAFEYEGGILCTFQKFFNSSKNYFLHSIELYEATSTSSFVRNTFAKASRVVTQDWVRKKRLCEMYDLPDFKLAVSVNSSRRSDTLDVSPLPFPDNIASKTKVLFIGSLIEEHCFSEVLTATQSIPDDMCLIIHGWGGKKYETQINELIGRRPDNVWLSNFQLSDVTKFRLYASIDIGLVTFNKNYFNTRNAGLSAGKLFDFMRVGKPVLASGIEGLDRFVTEHAVGKVVEDFSVLYQQASQIFDAYNLYAQNAKKLFVEYEFDESYQPVYEQFIALK